MKFRIFFWFLLISYFLFCLYKFFSTYIEFNAELDKLETQLNAHDHIILINMNNMDQKQNEEEEKFMYKMLGISKNEILFNWK